MSVTNNRFAQRKSDLAARRAALSSLEQQELAERLQQGNDASLLAKAIPPRPAGESAPLSFAQERLWFLQQLEPESVAYNICMPFRIAGKLNLAALRQSISETTRRHDTLRTRFLHTNGRPFQVIMPPSHPDIPLVDLTGMPEQLREVRVQQILATASNRSFDLAQGPLLRAVLLKLGNEEHVLMMLLHHIVFDEWSMRVLIREAVQIYQALSLGQPSPLPALPIQYADFAHWQRQWLRGEVLEEELSYWRRQLRESPQLLNLSTDHPRLAATNAKAESVPITIPDLVSQQLMALTRETRGTLFMTLLASFQILLSRYTGQHDIPVGTPYAGRRVETEGIIGFFVNTLVMRTQLSGNPTVREILHRVRGVSLEAMSHQELPFEKLVEELQPERSLSHAPLFQVMFAFQNEQKEAGADMPGLQVSALEGGSAAAKFDLILGMAETDGKIYGTLEYDTSLFERATIERMLKHYGAILAGMGANPDQRLSEIEMLSAAERQELLYDWNQTAAAYPRACIHHLFEEQVERTPDAIAVEAGSVQLSYRELNSRANRLAHQLRQLGVEAESIVGLRMGASAEMLVGLLGILKAGGAYLPLDPSYPPERVSLMLDDARVNVVVTGSFANGLPQRGPDLVCLNPEDPSFAGLSEANPTALSNAGNMAYVIYTSGSTGNPKGVAVNHGSLVSYINGTTKRFGMTQSDRILQFTALSFDVSVEEIFWALTNGGRLVLRDDEMLVSPDQFLRECRKLAISVLDVPTAYWNELATSSEWETMSELRLVLIGGEKAMPEKVAQWTAGPGRRLRLVNAYGPTETTIVATCKEVTAVDSAREVPIGRPVSNMRAYILDEYFRPAPVGVVGELCLGGAGLARGYLGRPESTAEKFVPDPFAPDRGARLYRTGDVARYRPNGDIDFAGRVDGQIKLRGYRIEVGEIEAALSAHEGVSEVAVIAREAVLGGQRLVAYVVATRSGARPTSESLQSYLRARLPDYMVPSAFMLIDALPLTAGGKVDRRALPVPQEIEHRQAYVAPRTPTEEIMAGVWAMVLGIEHVGVEDNFFDLGGHSLLAMQLVSRIREAFAVELPLRSLFEQPSTAALAQTIDDLLRGPEKTLLPPLIPIGRDQALPLSFAQQRLWFLDQLEPGSTLYHVREVVPLHGALNIEALERAIGELVKRHESLRTVFVRRDGQPLQLILPPTPFTLTVEDLSEFEEGPRQSKLHELLAEEAAQPFDLSMGPLLRARLFRLGDDQHVLAATMHHIISDGWSMNLLTRELGLLYGAYCSGLESPLSELVVQYADYAVWQREWLQGEVLERQLEYWREQLAQTPPVLDMPADKPRPAVRSHRGDSVPLRLNSETAEKLKAVSRRHGATLFMTLLAGFQALLSRWTGQSDLVVGTPVAGRNRSELEPVIGFFVNTLALRTDLSGNPTFGELLQRVREVCLGAYGHQEVPFEKLVDELGVERDLSRTPLFQVMMVMEHEGAEKLTLAGLNSTSLSAVEAEIDATEPVSGRGQMSKFDLMLALSERESGLHGRLQYSSELFERESIERLVVQFERALTAWANDDQQPVGNVELLSEEEHAQVVVDWNQTRRDYDPAGGIAAAFEQRVAAGGAAIALKFEDQEVSYAELNRRANQLADYLRSRGVGPEQVVGVFLDRSVEQMVALLGVLKSGAAYLPLDVRYPAERLRYMAEDSGVEIIVTASGRSLKTGSGPVANDSPFGAHVEIIDLDEQHELLAAQSPSNFSTNVSPDNLAYIIYTSGSTGRPKGVMVTQRAILNHLHWRQESYPLQPSDRFLQKAAFGFDISVWEIFGTLLAGAGLVLARPGSEGDPEYLANLIAAEGVTHAHFGPAMLAQFLAAEGVGRCHGLRSVFCGGEPLSPELQRRFHERLPATLHHQYGPTETCVDVTVWNCERDQEALIVPIGKPIANTQAYVLDDRLRPVPIGVAGELYVGGAALARGYYQQPELTAGRFIPDPFSHRPGGRLYRTGDRARYLSDGNLQFLGRLDDQVKIRGYRIEIGEIESILSGYPGVRQAKVIAREDTPHEKRLVAYVVAQDEIAGAAVIGQPASLTVAELRDYLAERLPYYMIPAFFVLLDTIPLNASGKVDRRALPVPDLFRDFRQVYVGPSTLTEELLSSIWAAVLGLERVGVEDNFFEIGGHSLLATQVISRIREAFAIELPLRALFDRPTVAALAPCVEECRRGGVSEKAPLLVQVARDAQLPLSFAQQRLWFLDQLEPLSAAYNIPDAVRMKGALDQTALQRSLTELVNRHESLRTIFVEVAGHPVQVIEGPRPFALRVEDLSELTATAREAELCRLLEHEANQPFKLSTGPLLRIRLFRLGPEEHILAATMHHIISDGWSMGLLTRELAALYNAHVEGAIPPLPESRLQYADFAVWQRQWLRDEVLERQLGYWRAQLANVPNVLELPTDRPRPPVQSHWGGSRRLRLDAATVNGLKAVSRSQGTTLFMTILAGFQLLLSRWSGQRDIVVGTPVAGRTRAETEAVIGFFINTLALRTDLSGNPAFSELVRRVREVCLSAYAHQEVPFEKLVEELGVERDLSRTPLFQVMMVWQNTVEKQMEMNGLWLEPLRTENEQVTNNRAKFDLLLSLSEQGEEISGSLEYSADLFDAETIDRFAEQLERVLKICGHDQDQRIDEVSLLTEAEREQVVVDWNRSREYQTNSSLAEHFALAAATRPDAVALKFEDQELTYAELDRRSNQLARYLRSRGVAMEVRVGLLLERSPLMVVSILGVLKAGGVYVPLDIAAPQERLRFMLEDSGCAIVLTERALSEHLPELPTAVAALDTKWKEISSQSEHSLDVGIKPENAAYVIYTSGSTGNPKGVVVTHGNVLRLMAATEDWFSFGAHDVWTMFHSYSFDFSVWEIWGALLYGGRLVIVPFWVSRAPEAFYELLTQEQVTVLNQTPSAFRQLMQAEQQLLRRQEVSNVASELSTAGDLSLRLVIFGGEALEPATLRTWYDLHDGSHPRLVNMYGITETTVHVTRRELNRSDVESGRGSVIGWRIPDLEVYILDERKEPAPIGVAGEIYVGGGGLARGYLRGPALTAERFVPHPFSSRPGARLYCTGDRGRYLPDGDIEYLGRLDNQVKIRGFRVETGEVEAALAAHAGVKEAVVVAGGAGADGKHLVAYFVSEDAANGDAAELQEATPAKGKVDELRRHLRERLPDYMVPSYFVRLDVLPLTVNGKIDRRALPAPELNGSELRSAYVAPRGLTENVLVEIWEQVLNVQEIGTSDNFFALGGDSIRSVRVVALAREQGLNFTLQQLFQHQTVAELTQLTRVGGVTGGWDGEESLQTAPFSLISNEDREKLPAGIEDAYPLAMLQAGMLFHSEYNRESALYHNYSSYYLRAPFNLAALEEACRRLLQRHATLRTSFDLTGFSMPLQLVHQQVELPLQVEDLRHLSDVQQTQAIVEWQAAERQQFIDWRRAPLLRLHIHRRSDDAFQFSFAEHHAILDGWSVAAMLTELFNLYSSLLDDADAAVQSPPAATVRDFVALEQRALASGECEKYWHQALSGCSQISLPRRGSQSGENETHFVQVPLPAKLSADLKHLAQVAGTPLKSVLLAAHLRVMSLLGGQRDVLTGVVSHGRPENIDAERVLGLFLNTLPFRLQLKGSWIELIQETFAAERDSLPYRYYPMAQMRINQGGQQLFETAFNYTHFHVYEDFETQSGIEVLDHSDFAETEFAFGADFSLDALSTRIELSLTGNGEVLNSEQMAAISSYYAAALQAMVDEPHQRYDHRSLLSAAEQQLQLVEWNQTEADYPHACLHQLFESQVNRSPAAVAVVSGTEHVTYDEINRRANQLAHRLRRLGVGPEVPVAVCLDRSVDLIVSLYGILKAGGVYLPLDPSNPAERLNFMLEDAATPVLISQLNLISQLAEGKAQAINLDTDWRELAAEDDRNPVNPTTPDTLSYIIYTSGSTGVPKGVSISQRSVMNYVNWFRTEMALTPGDRLLQFAAPGFDVSLEEIFSTLTSGATLVLRTEEMLSSGKAFFEICAAEGVSVLNIPTQYWHELARDLAERPQGLPASVRLVILGGEQALSTPMQEWLKRAGTDIRIVNAYGPTETTIVATYCRMSLSQGWRSVPIGQPVANAQAYVLDAAQQPVPVGVAGELHIGGLGLARGYLNRPDLTAGLFIPDPYGSKPGSRLYQTGDLARYLTDGNLEFLGRIDHQVKVRGFRVELGEIETMLLQHPQVSECVVLARDDVPGDRRLAAYLVTAGGEIDIGQMRSFLGARLAEYMVPSHFVVLDALPVTPNGKVDRKALPAPDQTRLEGREKFVAPRTPIEEVLATIWKLVLRMEQIGRRDNFFWLGGHSLLATQIISRVRETFQVELPVRSIFESPTLAELAERIEAMMRSGAITAAAPLQHLPANDQLPLSYAQQRLWFLDQLMPGSNAYNLPAEMYIDAALDVPAFEQALGEIVRRHEALRTSFVRAGGQPIQKIHPPAPVQLALADLSGLSNEDREAQAETLRHAHALRPFDLAAGPLLQALLIRIDQQRYLFLLNMHHIISDGWSMGVLMDEMETLYKTYTRGEASSLPELAIQYGDYAQWQRSWLQGEVLNQEITYWKEQLAGAPTLLELETDHPRQLLRAPRSAHCPVVFSEQTSQLLREFSREQGASIFMTLMAGFHALLWRYTGQSDILVGTPIAGRNHLELESMIGFFVNMIPIRTSFGDAPTFRELLTQVRESSFAAYTHQELPFDKLVEELQPKRAPGRNPIFQTILAFQNASPEMEIAKVNVPAGVPVSADAKFDLEVHVWDTPAGLAGSFVFSPELFEPTFIARMVDHFRRLFEKALAAPDAELSTLSLLSGEEYRQIVEEWNDTATAFPDAACIHEVFEQEAALRPDAIAVEFEEQNLSYGELNRRANVLAHRLQQAGVGLEVLVGVMLERSTELIVALLAVAKSGGVYVPINLADPASRIRFILQDTGISTLLTSQRIAAEMPDTGLTVVCVDAEEYCRELIEVEFVDNPVSGVMPANLAYLTYTSGSTGVPKGVCITQRNVLGLVKGANYADLNSEEIFLQFAPVSFDASTFEVWGCLLNGARLVVFPPVVPSLSELGEFIAKTQVTTLFFTTGLFHQFVDTQIKSVGAVRQLLAGGDALSPTHVNKAMEQMEGCQFINGYGPTETTTFACCYSVGADRLANSVPIGRPVSNTRVYVIRAMQPAGIGESGEIFIGGAGIGRGYHGRPELTAERFLPDPYGAQPGGRLYRTGDAARYSNQGVIQFLGRLDNQVKISGFRIEPGEIEVALSEHPSVSSAVVLAREDTPGDKRLVAYVVADAITPSVEDLRAHLRERLPEYMVPSAFVMLEVLPLTQHGKVDRAALPAPQVSLSRSGREYIAPRNGLQQQLVDIWEELFKLSPIGLSDNFFELGGHSLQMIMLVARVEERLGKRVSMADLFRDPTVEHLANLIGHGKENVFQSLVVPMRAEGARRALFSPHASGGHAWCYKDLVQYLDNDQPFYGIQAREPEEGLVAHMQIEAMASEYVEAIQSVQSSGPYLLCGWSMGGVIAFEMARQLQQRGERIGLLALLDSQAPSGEESEFKWSILLTIFAFDLGLKYENLSVSMEEIGRLPQMAQFRRVWTEARSNGVVPKDMTLIEFRKLFDIYKINANTMRSYLAKEYEGRITLFTPEQDMAEYVFSQDPEYLESLTSENYRKDPTKGWGKLASGGVDLQIVPGDHFSMIREPHVEVLSEKLRNCIDEAIRALDE